MGFEMQYRPNAALLQTDHERQMGLFLHLSQLGNMVFPPSGIIAPIIIWQVYKDKMPALDGHGKMVANWIISSVIYWAISFVLLFIFFIGVIPMLGLMVAGIVFPIIGAIKANNGEFWEYPMTIRFLK
ncbi:MAG TPA: DUF4870 domain-containing protein [Pyrinomonadaceae bacterium]|nr:DUF4870 domain-containing protein [Pyrinomonadaceae bacterium]